ncbi:MAG: hypothetical protein AB7F88_08070 [Pyrinomonadaceae bacterium]
MRKGASRLWIILVPLMLIFGLIFGSAVLCVLVQDFLPDTNSNRANVIPNFNVSATPRANTSTPDTNKGNTATPNTNKGNVATPGPTPAVEPTSERPTVDSIRESLAIGSIAFNKPSEMQLEEPKEVQLVLSPSVAVEELKKRVTGDGPIQGSEAQVSDYMEATLYGDNFLITNATQRKLVSNKGVTEWRWDVTPTKAGKQRLHMSLSAIVNYKDGEKALEIETFHEVIAVNVTLSQRLYAFGNVIGSHLQWIAPSLLIPLGLWVWNRWRKKAKAGDAEAALPRSDDESPKAASASAKKLTKRSGRRT